MISRTSTAKRMCGKVTSRGDSVATVRGDDITIGGERSAVDFLIKVMSRKYEIKKQVIGGDPDLEKSGRILNRVIEWNRDGITIEADQRHAREILKGLELERANHTATPCAVDRKDEDGARMMKARVRVDVDGPGPSTSGTDHRWQMTMPTTARHSLVVTSRGAGHLLHESATCVKIDQISSLPRCRYAVQWQNPQCVTWFRLLGDRCRLESS